MFKKLWFFFFPPVYLKEAKERRNLIRKVYYYRRNQLSDEARIALGTLAAQYKAAYGAHDKLRLSQLHKDSDKILSAFGGHYHRHYHWFENVETLVVAAILAIGIRTYFLQPFKIPTSSMWPTYHGMTYTLRDASEPLPSPVMSAYRLVFGGATQHTAIAPASGELLIPVFDYETRQSTHSVFRYQLSTRNFLGLIPVSVRAYDFYVGGSTATITVPADYSLDNLILQKFFPHAANSATGQGTPLKLTADNLAHTGINLTAGERIVSFELQTGDMLFVDRASYNFTGAPRVGDPIVFRTRAIQGLAEMNGGRPDDKYYIKRLAAFSGDTLRVQNFGLLRNGQPITGSPIFTLNATRTPPYRGYQPEGALSDGATVEVPTNYCFAMGDNSLESLDSRYWGPFNKSELVGRAVFIYYPFSPRWGLSH